MKKNIKKLKSEGSSCMAVPKQGELPYYGLQITYSDWTFSVRISSIWWFKHFISSRWDCLIIVSIIAEGKPTFKDKRKKAAEWFIDKKYILHLQISNLNNRFEWGSLDWKFIIPKVFFCRIIHYISMTKVSCWGSLT